MKTAELRTYLFAAIATATFAGCHAIGDPTCAVCEEVADERCRNALYAPQLSLEGLNKTAWYCCPLNARWSCPPLFRCRPVPRRLPPPEAIFALPDSPSAPAADSPSVPAE